MDHIISAKEIHEDRGRVLAGLQGEDLANSDENLTPTNRHTNRSKKADSMDAVLKRRGDEYSESEKERMMGKDRRVREVYNQKVERAYYTSAKFRQDVAIAATDVGTRMGVREALGFVFTEIWFCVKDEINAFSNSSDFDLADFFSAVGRGIERGWELAKRKYKELFSRFITGAVSGALASLTTTLCNIFFTTAKNVVTIIR